MRESDYNVFPDEAALDIGDGLKADSVTVANGFLGFAVSQSLLNISHFLVGQLCASCLLANTQRDQAQSSRMCRLFFHRRVFQILRSIVGFDSVDVVDCLSLRTGANESQCNKTMDFEKALRFVAAKSQLKVLLSLDGTRFENAPTFSARARNQAEDAPQRRDGIESFPFGYISPFFIWQRDDCGIKDLRPCFQSLSVLRLMAKSSATLAVGQVASFWKTFAWIAQIANRARWMCYILCSHVASITGYVAGQRVCCTPGPSCF